jgi:hypothetical protein
MRECAIKTRRQKGTPAESVSALSRRLRLRAVASSFRVTRPSSNTYSSNLAYTLLVGATALLLLRRLLLSVRRQRVMALDVKPAPEVQQLICQIR